MDKLDFLKEDKKLYTAKTEPELVVVPEQKYIMVDGKGMPETTPAFQEAFRLLYGIAYTIKFMPRQGETPEGWQDFKVPPPEGLWWVAGDRDFSKVPAEDWHWTLMIRMPEFVTQEVLNAAVSLLSQRKHDESYRQVRLGNMREGISVQIMHIGPYDEETATLQKLNAYTKQHGYRYHGKHHEIYFGDPRRTRPDKLKTLLRHPIAV